MVDKTLNVAIRVWEDLSRTEEEWREYEIRLKQILDEQSKKRDRELLEQEMEEMREQREEMKMEKEELKAENEEIKAEKEEAERKRLEAESALKESAKQMALKMLEQGISQTAILQVTGLTLQQFEVIQQELGNKNK